MGLLAWDEVRQGMGRLLIEHDNVMGMGVEKQSRVVSMVPSRGVQIEGGVWRGLLAGAFA